MTLALPLTREPAVAGAWRWGGRQRLWVELDRRVRAPLPTSRRISVLSLAGGTGASSVAAGVAALAAARRAAPVLAVDACGAAGGLGAKLGGDEESRITLPDARRDDPQTFADASAGLARRGTLFRVGLGHPASASWPADVEEWRAAVGQIGRFFPLVVTDWGRRRDLRTIADITRASHAVCLVATADRAGLESAASLVEAIRGETPRPDVVIALVDRSGDGAAGTTLRLGALDASVLRVRFDAALASGSPAMPRTRRAWLAIAAELIDGADSRRDAEGDA